MKLISVAPHRLHTVPELTRTGSTRQFFDRLQSSIDEIGLAEPLKIARQPDGTYIVVDGVLRLRAIEGIREANPKRFVKVQAYLVDYDRRFEIRYQTDVYQDLLPSQLATLVEHLHAAERVRKADIARYIGVSPATLRNYTGLWRLVQRGGLFARVVDLMDVGVLPSSNPYAWLRLTSAGLEKVLENHFADGQGASQWIDHVVRTARGGERLHFTTTFVEESTGSLLPEYYRVDADTREIKKDLGHRKGRRQSSLSDGVTGTKAWVSNLRRVARQSPDDVLRGAALSLLEYLT